MVFNPNRRLYLLIYLCLMLSCLVPSTLMAQDSSRVKVQVVEQDTGYPIPGVVIKSGSSGFVTDADGYCSIPTSSDSKVTLSLKSLGYKEIKSHTFQYRKGTVLVIKMAASVELLQEVTVVAERRHTTNQQHSVMISKKEMEKAPSLTLAKLLETVPGVSSISSGSNISKPVIQGMHGSRILLMNNGVRLESQSWGEDHAPEIDHTGASLIEVVKGAEAIRYGYGAEGGVVLFNQAPLPFGHQKFHVSGKLNSGFETNGRGYDVAGSLNFGYKEWGLRLHGMYKRTGDYSTAEYILNNTGIQNISFSGTAGYENRWLTATIYSSLYYLRSGIYYASKISDVNQLLERFKAGRPDEDTFKPFSYQIVPPFQQVQHFTVKGDIEARVHPRHTLQLKVAYQDNLRQEFENRKIAAYSWLPMQDLRLITYNGDLTWDGKWNFWGMNTQAGLSGMYQYNLNYPGTKQPAFIPNYAAMTLGTFFLNKVTIGNLQASVGARYDLRAMHVDGYKSLTNFEYFNDFMVHQNVTGTLAAHYQISNNIDVRGNIGLAWRPPSINELYAAGLHHGIYWVVGNPDLSSEVGYKAILAGRYHNSWLSIEPSAFYQRINNYIYDNIGEGKNRFHNHPSGKYPKFIFTQDDARFVGGDLTIVVAPLAGLSFTGKGEWINARNLSTGAWLPFMPSDRYTLEANYSFDFGKGEEKRWHAGFSLDGKYVTKQYRFDPDKDLVPDSPPAYALINAHAELKYDLPKERYIQFMLMGDNLFNSLYKEYTDRFRYYAHARGAQISLRTIISF